MMQLLNKGGSWPSGGYPFTDPKTGKVFDGMSADLRLQTQNVIKHRLANPRLYPPEDRSHLDFDNVQQEIVEQICAKKPELCGQAALSMKPSTYTQPQPPSGKTCYKCGGKDFTPVYCKTCSGQRVKFWKCNKCNTENPK